MRLILICLMLTGCASMPGGVSTHESKVDNSKQVNLEPGWLPDSMVKLGLNYSSDDKPGMLTLVVSVKANAAATKEGVTINVDGTKTVLSAMDDISDADQYGFLRKRYPIKLELVRQMVAGKSVHVRINHVGQTYQEGEFSKGGSTTAKNGFIKFLETLDGKK